MLYLFWNAMPPIDTKRHYEIDAEQAPIRGAWCDDDGVSVLGQFVWIISGILIQNEIICDRSISLPRLIFLLIIQILLWRINKIKSKT